MSNPFSPGPEITYHELSEDLTPRPRPPPTKTQKAIVVLKLLFGLACLAIAFFVGYQYFHEPKFNCRDPQNQCTGYSQANVTNCFGVSATCLTCQDCLIVNVTGSTCLPPKCSHVLKKIEGYMILAVLLIGTGFCCFCVVYADYFGQTFDTKTNLETVH